MSKVILFSRFFPKTHRRAGEPTYFVEKIYKSLFIMKSVPINLSTTYNWSIMNDDKINGKFHTIRAGKRWKVGDKFSPRVWSVKPYCSPQITIAPDIEIKKIWDIEIDVIKNNIHNYKEIFIKINGNIYLDKKRLADNDGLDAQDFIEWFDTGKKFIGQIICWSEDLTYDNIPPYANFHL